MFFILKNVGIDLGTANTVIFVQKRGYVVNQPSVVAYLEDRKEPLVGIEAHRMLGKTHSGIRVIRPLANGVIADFGAAEDMVKGLIHQAAIPLFLIRRVVIGVPTGITSVERRAVIESVQTAGVRHVYLVAEPMAAAIGVGLDVLGPSAHMIVDIGGGTTDIAVINYGGIVLDNTLRIAGVEMTDSIIAYIKNRYHMHIGEATAEHIKMQYGIATKSQQERRFLLKGIDLHNNLPREIRVSNYLFLHALSAILNTISEAVLATLDQLPPELAGDIIDHGIILTGGGSLLKGLDEYLRDRVQVPVSRPDNALLCVAEGTRKIMENFKLFQPVLF